MASGTGIRDWLIQRVTAVVLGVYTVVLLFYIINTPDLTFATWSECFSHPLMQVATFLALVSLMLHAWVGIWTVATDYIKCAAIRWAFLGAVLVGLLGYFAWGIIILWG